MDLKQKENIQKKYKDSLEKFFPRFPKNRVIVRITHSDTNLCLNSDEREILLSVQELFDTYYNIAWEYNENLWGKSLKCSFDYIIHTPNFDSIYPIYKKYYMKRFNLIFSQYDLRVNQNAISNQLLISDYANIKLKINKLKKNTVFNLKQLISKIDIIKDVHSLIYDFSKENLLEYYQLRQEMEKLRHKVNNQT